MITLDAINVLILLLIMLILIGAYLWTKNGKK